MTLPFTFDTLCSFLADYHKRIRTENILYIVSAKQLYKDLEVAAPAPVIAEPLATVSIETLGHHIFCNGDTRKPVTGCQWCNPRPSEGFWYSDPPIRVLAAATPAVTGAPAEPEEYPHLMICNGSRRYPAGIPGHGCCCFNIGTEYLQMAARKMRADGAAAVPTDEGLREALGQFQKAYSHFRAYLPDGNYEGIGLLTEAYSRVAALTLHEVK